jgi:hypothetical protein
MAAVTLKRKKEDSDDSFAVSAVTAHRSARLSSRSAQDLLDQIGMS